MRILISALMAFILLTPSYASDTEATGDTGQFHYKVSQIDLTHSPGNKFGIKATVGFQITNGGRSPVRVAIVPVMPTVQLQGASVELRSSASTVSGIATFWINQVSYCAQGADNFTLLRPNSMVVGNLVLDARMSDSDLPLSKRARFTANLMVQSLEDKKCWIEPFSVVDVPVSPSG